MKKALSMIMVAAAIVVLQTASQAADKTGPGKVVLTFMERLETHTEVADPAGVLSGETFLYSMISAYRKLDKGVAGNVYYMHKLSIDDGETVSHISGITLTDDFTGKWQGDIGYSYSSNPARVPVTGSLRQSDRFSLGLGFKLNPGEKKRKRYDFKTSFNTATDFSQGRTLSEKLTVTDNLTKKITYKLGYQFVWGLTEINNAAGICSVCKEHYANQWSADFDYKLGKKDKISLGYLYLNNLYNGAKSDDGITKLSFFHTK